MYDIVIIGGGVVGCLIARELSQYSASVLLLESAKALATKSTSANSGIIHPGFFDPTIKLKAKLNMEGNREMEALCGKLKVPFKRTGAFMLAYNSEQEEILHHYLAQGLENGVPGIAVLTGSEARLLEPNLSAEVTAVLSAPSTAIVDPPALALAAWKEARETGAELRCGFRVTSIVKTVHGFSVCSESDRVETKVVVNAAGVYADEINNFVSAEKFHIEPVKGEYCRLDPSFRSLISRPLYQTPRGKFKGILMTPTPDGSILLGPTEADTAGKEDYAVTAIGIETIFNDTSKMLKYLPASHAIPYHAGLRAVSPIGDFIIGEAADAKGFVNAAAIESPGLTASPAIAKLVTRIIGEQCLKLTQPIKRTNRSE